MWERKAERSERRVGVGGFKSTPLSHADIIRINYHPHVSRKYGGAEQKFSGGDEGCEYAPTHPPTIPDEPSPIVSIEEIEDEGQDEVSVPTGKRVKGNETGGGYKKKRGRKKCKAKACVKKRKTVKRAGKKKGKKKGGKSRKTLSLFGRKYKANRDIFKNLA